MTRVARSLTFALALAGCAGGLDKPDIDPTKGGPEGKAEAWGSSDRPSLMGANLEYRVAELPRAGEASKIPWAGYYWPTYQDAINHRWAGASSRSPAEKYGLSFGVAGVEDAVSRYHGIESVEGKSCTTTSQCAGGEACAKRRGATSGRCIPTWFGICHAWSPASILLPEPRYPVTYGGVTFQINDLKALASLVHDEVEDRGVSLRCDDDEGELTTDEFGRPPSRCRDTNPGTWHVLATNYFGLQGEAFVYDRTWDDEVWNQPVRGYRITRQTAISAVDANALLGATGSTYAFNSRAATLYRVHMDVDWITESPAGQDGNLASRIDQYTNVDRLDYILEVDGAGKIIGGEWLGDSRQAHPDFVWQPTRVQKASVAGGKITYANIKMLLDRAQHPDDGDVTPPAGDTTEVQEGATLAATRWKHYGPFAVASGKRLSATLSGTGDGDLYVRKGARPTAASYDCRPYEDGSDERCTVTGGGDWYVSVNAATATTFELAIAYTAGASGPTEPTPTGEVVHLDLTASVAADGARRYTVDVVAGRKIYVRTFSNQDVDLYVQLGEAPTTEAYLKRAWTSSGKETISLTPSSSGTLHILVFGYEAADFTLRTADL